LLPTVLSILAVASGPNAFAQQAEDTYYEPFAPNAPELVFASPKLAEIEFFSVRTNAKERRIIDPRLLEAPAGLEIYMFQIGQADAMLVVGPGPQRRSMLIDLGVSNEPGFSGRFSAQLVGQRIIDITGKRAVDYFLLSHLHSDHFGSGDSGITALVAHGGFKVGTIIDTGPLGAKYVKRSAGATDYVARTADWVTQGKVGRVVRPTFGNGQIDLGAGVTIDVQAFAGQTGPGDPGVHARYEQAHPNHYASKPTSENDLSIALKLQVGDFEFWSAGDLSGAQGPGTAELSGSSKNYTNIELPMVKRWKADNRETDVEIYRASHHGSQYSSTPQLLTALDPEVILYSARSGYGHPTPAMVKRAQTTVPIQFATGFDPESWTADSFAKAGGTVVSEIQIIVAPDGKSYTINGKPFQSFSDAEEQAGVDSQ
jgi:beta-lactamase superfamily II metal-dependent hydrolase